MADSRLNRTSITFWLAFPEAFDDWREPTAAEFSAGIAAGLIHNLTCALSEDGTQFDKDSSESDDSLSFCQEAGVISPTFHNATIVYQAFRSADPLASNTANTALSLLNYPDVEYFAIMRVGPEPDVTVANGDRLKIARVLTDNPVDVVDAGSNEQISNSFLFQGDLAWNVEVGA